jgi:outer membrane receptor protein involved in Fe transport
LFQINIYSPTKTTNIRAAYSQTVIRPDLKDLADFYRYDFQAFRFTTGNSELKSTSITNYDLKFEWFPSAGEIISFGAFYKKLIDPIEYGEVTAANTYIGKLAINSGDAYVKGIESEVRKKLDFISFLPWLKNVTLFGNGALLESAVKDRIIYNPFYDFSPAHSLTGQPKYIINAGINISAFKNTFEATLNYNRTGDYIDQLGSSTFLFGGPPVPGGGSIPAIPYGKPVLQIPNFILQARDIIDISIRQNVLKGKGVFKFRVANLLSKPLVIYQDLNGNNKYDKVPFKRIINYDAEQAVAQGAIDNIASIITGQRNISLAFTYTF